MATVEALLILLAAILLSSIINQFLPRFSVPIVQMALGIVIALVFPHFNIRFEPEMLMLVLIAPLIFNEARKADRRALWRLKWPIIGLAIGLVALETIALGALLNYLIAGLSLAGALALVAALSPTDSAAVSALGDQASLSDTSEQLLAGEALINDASGIVAFQFALAAALTGHFSVSAATQHFFFVFIGGLVVGAVFGIGRALFVRWVHGIGIDDITFHIIIELLTPFLAFLIAEALGVSGILAVVAAGFGISFRSHRRTTPDSARQRLVSSSVWSVVSFILSGLVFLLLGTELPASLRAIHATSPQSVGLLIIYVLVATVALYVLRLLWTALLLALRELVEVRERRPQMRHERSLRELLTLTFAGPRGAVALGIALTIPVMAAPGRLFPNRSLIIAVAAGVIVLTLLVANFLLPILAPAHEREATAEETQTMLKILHDVIAQLRAESAEAGLLASELVIRSYQTRIQALEDHISGSALNQVRLQALGFEEERTAQLVSAGQISPQLNLLALQQIKRERNFLAHRSDHGWLFTIISLLLRRGHTRRIIEQQQQEESGTHAKLTKPPKHQTARHPQKPKDQPRPSGNAALKSRVTLAEESRQLRLENYRFAAEQLERLLSSNPGSERTLKAVIGEYQRRIERLEGVETKLVDRDLAEELQRGPASLATHAAEQAQALSQQRASERGDPVARDDLERAVVHITARGLELERAGINQAADDELLSHETAKELRDNIAFMELDLAES